MVTNMIFKGPSMAYLMDGRGNPAPHADLVARGFTMDAAGYARLQEGVSAYHQALARNERVEYFDHPFGYFKESPLKKHLLQFDAENERLSGLAMTIPWDLMRVPPPESNPLLGRNHAWLRNEVDVLSRSTNWYDRLTAIAMVDTHAKKSRYDNLSPEEMGEQMMSHLDKYNNWCREMFGPYRERIFGKALCEADKLLTILEKVKRAEKMSMASNPAGTRERIAISISKLAIRRDRLNGIMGILSNLYPRDGHPVQDGDKFGNLKDAIELFDKSVVQFLTGLAEKHDIHITVEELGAGMEDRASSIAWQKRDAWWGLDHETRLLNIRG